MGLKKDRFEDGTSCPAINHTNGTCRVAPEPRRVVAKCYDKYEWSKCEIFADFEKVIEKEKIVLG